MNTFHSSSGMYAADEKGVGSKLNFGLKESMLDEKDHDHVGYKYGANEYKGEPIIEANLPSAIIAMAEGPGNSAIAFTIPDCVMTHTYTRWRSEQPTEESERSSCCRCSE
jgi:hypothetical protein